MMPRSVLMAPFLGGLLSLGLVACDLETADSSGDAGNDASRANGAGDTAICDRVAQYLAARCNQAVLGAATADCKRAVSDVRCGSLQQAVYQCSMDRGSCQGVPTACAAQESTYENCLKGLATPDGG